MKALFASAEGSTNGDTYRDVPVLLLEGEGQDRLAALARSVPVQLTEGLGHESVVKVVAREELEAVQPDADEHDEEAQAERAVDEAEGAQHGGRPVMDLLANVARHLVIRQINQSLKLFF